MANIPAIIFKEAIIWDDLSSNIRNISSYNMLKKNIQRVCDEEIIIIVLVHISL